ncbi:hypothetical protein IWQ62_005349 [Dispira parvispora]|uniref:SNF2 N-terminal domain-containing protein n=1 Tax=Dispira parvispora TaxID=1520584 RepID=A0A9W8DZR3_9FUNG|nr:hypothetical protein IWQ62_005349 [Dispira parvispora]
MATDNEIIYKLMVNLPSPSVDEVDPLGFYDDLFAPLHRNGPIEGMVTPLYQYQRAAVTRMLHQELYPPGYVPTLGKLPMDTYPPELRSEPISCSYGCGKHHYSPAVNPLPKDMKTSTDTTTVRTRGGILAEDPRSGKILELLTLILLTKDQMACPTALDVPFTRTACHLTYQAYLDHSFLSPYRYPGRITKSNVKSVSDNESDESDVDDEMYETELSCFPGRGVCAPLRYLTLREVVHCPRLAGKALGEFLPPDLQEFTTSAGFSYIADNEFADTYYKKRNVTIPDNVKQHHQDLVFFTPATPNIRKFKGIPESISFQRPKVWKRLTKPIPVASRYLNPRPSIPVHPSRATLVILPESSIKVWISEIEKHMVLGTLKYTTILRKRNLEIAKLLKCDLVFISSPCLYEIRKSYPDTIGK